MNVLALLYVCLSVNNISIRNLELSLLWVVLGNRFYLVGALGLTLFVIPCIFINNTENIFEKLFSIKRKHIFV